jgi:hypothetical protein
MNKMLSFYSASPFTQVKMLRDALLVVSDLSKAAVAHGHVDLCAELSRQRREIGAEIKRREIAAASAIAGSRGWILAESKAFDFVGLADPAAPPITEPNMFSGTNDGWDWHWFTKNGKPAALLIPDTRGWEWSKRFAKEKMLDVELVEYPWGYPDKIAASLYTPVKKQMALGGMLAPPPRPFPLAISALRK